MSHVTHPSHPLGRSMVSKGNDIWSTERGIFYGIKRPAPNGETKRDKDQEYTKGLELWKTSQRPFNKDKGLNKWSKKGWHQGSVKLLDCWKKKPSIVDKEINNWQNWNAMNNELHYSSHPQKQRQRMEWLDNNPRAAEIKNQWTTGLLDEGTLDGRQGGK